MTSQHFLFFQNLSSSLLPKDDYHEEGRRTPFPVRRKGNATFIRKKDEAMQKAKGFVFRCCSHWKPLRDGLSSSNHRLLLLFLIAILSSQQPQR
jgi:hypothetical protein